MLNASGNALNATYAGTFINPIRIANSTNFSATPSLLMYDTVNNEIGYSTATTTPGKTFVVDHPIDPKKYLVHACLEGPEAGIYYRGEAEIIKQSIDVSLPEYACLIGHNWSIHLTPIGEKFNGLSCSKVNKKGIFKVFGNMGSFYWVVYGERASFNIEPLKVDVNVKGDGPYTWI